jgi:hypothetical protein
MIFILLILAYLVTVVLANIVIRCSGLVNTWNYQANEEIVIYSVLWPPMLICLILMLISKGLNQSAIRITKKVCPQ